MIGNKKYPCPECGRETAVHSEGWLYDHRRANDSPGDEICSGSGVTVLTMPEEEQEEQLAFDGSNEPQLRDLTARERDILCRLLSEELHRTASSLIIDSPLALLPGRWDSKQLQEMRYILDPRRDH